jgi:hypothetical protein
MNREDEQLVLQLLRYTWQGLSAFPAGRDHGRDALCAEAADRGVSRLTPPRHCAAESPPP